MFVLCDVMFSYKDLRDCIVCFVGWLCSVVFELGVCVVSWVVKGEFICLMLFVVVCVGLVYVLINLLFKYV